MIEQETLVMHFKIIGLSLIHITFLTYFNWKEDLIYSELGKTISLGIGVFWFMKFVIQFVVYNTV